jgi:hypothetical protein
MSSFSRELVIEKVKIGQIADLILQNPYLKFENNKQSNDVSIISPQVLYDNKN